jgi:G:T/U-mismatch repair DNA glycosylase
MNDFTITCPEDWYKIQSTTIKQWKTQHGMFIKDIQRLEKVVENHISEASKILVLHRRTGQQQYLDAAQQSYKNASDAIRVFSKRELLATLSQI